MLENIKSNFKNKHEENLLCKICQIENCTQKHLLYCKKLLGLNEYLTYIPEYEDIFDDDNIEEQMYIAKVMMENHTRKKKIIENYT